jgi:type I restriction enzyme M protein
LAVRGIVSTQGGIRGVLPSSLSKADALGTLIKKFLDPALNLSPNAVLNADGSVKPKDLDKHAMGSIFYTEEAGEHWTPRNAVRLMANLIFSCNARYGGDKLQNARLWGGSP